jgi:WD40 repeat protein
MTSIVDRLYGYDVFLAHRRSDGATYADRLSERLEKVGLRIFIDKKIYRPGDELAAATLRHIRMSTLLVVVGSPAIRESREPDWVLAEIGTYLETHSGNDRHVLPISFGGALQPGGTLTPVVVALLQSTIRREEPGDALTAPPSDGAINSIVQRFQRRNRDRVRLRVFQMLAAVFVVLLAIAATLGLVANRNDNRARQELRRAVALRLVAEGESKVGRSDARGDPRLLLQVLAASHLLPGPEATEAILNSLQRLSAIARIIPTTYENRCMAVSPQGALLVSGCERGILEIRSSTTGQLIGELSVPGGAHLNAVAFSPDGQTIAAGGEGGYVYRWNVLSRMAMDPPVKAHDGNITSLAYSADGTRMATGGADARVRLWMGDHLNPATSLSLQHLGEVSSVAVSRNGRLVVSGSADGDVRVWRIAERGVAAMQLLKQGAGVTAIALSPDDSFIASGDASGNVRLWDSTRGVTLGMQARAHKSGVSSLAFNSSGNLIASAGWDGLVHLWKSGELEPIGHAFAGHRDAVTSVAFTPTADLLVSAGGFDRTLRVWRLPPSGGLGRSSVAAEPGQKNRVTEVIFSPDGTSYAASGTDHLVRVWDTKSGNLKWKHPQDDWVNAIMFSPDGRRLVTGTQSGRIQVWDSGSGEQIGKPLEGWTGPVRGLSYTAGGGAIVAVGTTAVLRAWDARSWRTTFAGGPSTIGGLAVAGLATHSLVVIGGTGRTVEVWDLERGTRAPMTNMVHGASVSSIASSADGRWIASADVSGVIRLWNAITLKPHGLPLNGHTGGVHKVSFSSDGRFLLSAASGPSENLRLWDVETGSVVGESWSQHQGEVLGASISGDGRYIASGGGDGMVYLLPGPEAWVSALCSKLVGTMSKEQWRDWVSPELEYAAPCPNPR